MLSKETIERIKTYVEEFFPTEPVQYRDVIIGLAPAKRYFALFSKDGEILFPLSIKPNDKDFIPGLIEVIKLRKEPVIATSWCIFDVVDRATRTQWKNSYSVEIEVIDGEVNFDITTISNIVTEDHPVNFYHEFFKIYMHDGFRHEPKPFYGIDDLAQLLDGKDVEIRS